MMSKGGGGGGGGGVGGVWVGLIHRNLLKNNFGFTKEHFIIHNHASSDVFSDQSPLKSV